MFRLFIFLIHLPASAEICAHIAQPLPQSENLVQIRRKPEQLVIERDDVDDRLTPDGIEEHLGLLAHLVPLEIPTEDDLDWDDGIVLVRVTIVAVVQPREGTHLGQGE